MEEVDTFENTMPQVGRIFWCHALNVYLGLGLVGIIHEGKWLEDLWDISD